MRGYIREGICINEDIWYRFTSQKNKEWFITLCANTIGARTIEGYSMDDLLKAECIRIHSSEKHPFLHFNFRTNVNEHFMHGLKYWPESETDDSTEIKKTLNSIYGKGAFNMEYSVNKLIETSKEEAEKAIRDAYNAKMENVLANSEVGKTARTYIEAIKKHTSITFVAQDIKSLVPLESLTEKEKQEYVKLMNEASTEINKLHNKYNTCLALLSIATAYSDKVQILKDYGVI